MTTTWAEPRQLSLLPDPLDARFVEFHHANPHVYQRLVDMAREWQYSGHPRGSIAMFYEVLRHENGLNTTGEDVKLNNSYRSRYARLIEANERDLAGFFETRRLHGDQCP